jgi:hypothetical protein
VPGGLLLIVGVLPVGVTYVCNPNMRVYSAHGFMHTSIVYEIMNGHLPPSNPLLAGERLLYPWGHHAVVALVCSAFQIAPPNAFAAINVVALGLTLLLVFHTAGRLGYDRSGQILAVVLSVFGLTCFNKGPIADVFYRIPRPDFLANMVGRGTPPLEKFMNVNSMPLGILAFTLFVYSLIGLVTSPERRLRWCGGIAASALCGALFYQFLFLALGASSAATCLVLLAWKRRAALANVICIGLSTAAGTALASPFLLLLSSAGKSEPANISMALNEHFLLINCAQYLITVLPLGLVILMKRTALVRLYQTRPAATVMLITVIGTTALLFLGISVRANEYKFLAVNCVATGILGAACLRELFRSSTAMALGVTALFMLPVSSDLVNRWRPALWSVPDDYCIEGKYLKYKDPGKQELYTWISTHTPTDSVLIDSERSIPIFAQRQLYIGVDGPEPVASEGERQVDGWALSSDFIIRMVKGYEPGMVTKRQEVVGEVLDANAGRLRDETFAEIAQAHPQKHVYLVARKQALRDRYKDDPRFHKLFENECAAVFGLTSVH